MVVIHTGACEIDNNMEKIVNPHTPYSAREFETLDSV